MDFMTYLIKNLKTRTYGTNSNPGKGNGTHDEMNLDQGAGVTGATSIIADEPTVYSKAAENVATRATEKRIKSYEKSMETKNPGE